MSRFLVSFAILFFFHGVSAGKTLNRESPPAAGDDLEVVFATVIYRHGDRTPVDTYPTDPYKDRSNWPVGFGRLTPRGKRMQYNLGKYLRSRYGALLGVDYDEKVIYVRSTDVDRTLMSAESNLAGLYPPKGDQIWNKDIPWQPIPVHTVDLEADNLLSSHSNCPRMTELVEDVLKSPEVKKINEEYQWLYDYLAQNVNASVDNMREVNYLFDTLFIETVYNKTLPLWTKKVYPEKMRYLHDLSFTLTTWTHELKRLRAGPLISNIVDTFTKVSAGQFFASADDHGAIADHKLHRERKMNMYSGHDTTVSSFLNGLGMFDPPIAPPYASCIMIELLKGAQSGGHFVRFFYKNETNVNSEGSPADPNPYLLQLPGCDTTCPLEKFEELTRPLRPRNWERECRSESDYEDVVLDLVTTLSGVIGISLLCLVLSAVMFKLCCRHKSDIGGNYVEVGQDIP